MSYNFVADLKTSPAKSLSRAAVSVEVRAITMKLQSISSPLRVSESKCNRDETTLFFPKFDSNSSQSIRMELTESEVHLCRHQCRVQTGSAAKTKSARNITWNN